MKFGDIVVFSQRWFNSSYLLSMAWKEKQRNTRMVVITVDDDVITVAKEGRHRVETYHKSYLTKKRCLFF